jgi:hypothetical protein
MLGIRVSVVRQVVDTMVCLSHRLYIAFELEGICNPSPVNKRIY